MRLKRRLKVVFGLFTITIIILIWFHKGGNASDKDEVEEYDWSDTFWSDDSDMVRIPPKVIIPTLKSDQVSSLYHRYVNNIQIACQNIVRLGNQGEGGWDICDDEVYRPRHEKCLVYSFGIDNDFSFDRAVVQRYGCVVHAYDPSMEATNRDYGQNIHFHSVGLADAENTLAIEGQSWRMTTFRSLRQLQGHLQQPVDILKLDIEDWEWKALPQMLHTGMMKDVRQLVIELHLSIIRVDPGPVKYNMVLGVLKELYDAGFRIFWTHRNLFCKFYSFQAELYRTGCHEVSFININS